MKMHHKSKYKLSRRGLKAKYPNTARMPKIMRADPKQTELDYYGGITRKYHIPRLQPYIRKEEREQNMRRMYTRDEVIAILKEARRIRGRVGYRGEGNYVKRGGMMKPVTKGAPATHKYKMPLKKAVKEQIERERLEEELLELLEDDNSDYDDYDRYYREYSNDDDYPYADDDFDDDDDDGYYYR